MSRSKHVWMILAAVAAQPVRAQDNSADAAAVPGCADRARLETERAELKGEITRIAMSGSDRRQKRRGQDAGKMAAGTAAGLMLPFGLGLALKGTMMLAESAEKQARAKRPPQPEPVGPDVAALIERQHELEMQLAALEQNGCPAPASAANSKRG